MPIQCNHTKRGTLLISYGQELISLENSTILPLPNDHPHSPESHSIGASTCHGKGCLLPDIIVARVNSLTHLTESFDHFTGILARHIPRRITRDRLSIFQK